MYMYMYDVWNADFLGLSLAAYGLRKRGELAIARLTSQHTACNDVHQLGRVALHYRYTTINLSIWMRCASVKLLAECGTLTHARWPFHKFEQHEDKDGLPTLLRSQESQTNRRTQTKDHSETSQDQITQCCNSMLLYLTRKVLIMSYQRD
jgi:hypothetical protein